MADRAETGGDRRRQWVVVVGGTDGIALNAHRDFQLRLKFTRNGIRRKRSRRPSVRLINFVGYFHGRLQFDCKFIPNRQDDDDHHHLLA